MKKLTDAIKTIVEDTGLYCYDVLYEKENDRFFVRVLLDSQQGITIDDCSRVSQLVSDLLDEKDPFEDPYFLEVMSAGIEHALRNDEELALAVGKKIKVDTFDQSLTGQLIKYKDGTLTIQVDRKKIITVNVMDVTDCRLSL
jgi:ribosome maturation factor RimP